MKIKIERTLTDAFLIIEDEDCSFTKEGIGEDSFEIKMLSENRIKGVLTLYVKRTDNTMQFMYSIRGYVSLYEKYDKTELRSEQIIPIIKGINETLGRLETFLIKTDHVMLDPRYLFINSSSKELGLCVFPKEGLGLKEGLKTLAEFLISKTDHDENLAIDLSYGFYKQVMAGDYRFEELIESVSPNPQKESHAYDIIDDPRSDISEKRKAENESLKKKENNNFGKSIIAMLVLVIVIFCFSLCVLMLYFR